ncbi:MAG: putative SapB synthase [Pseudonocardiales bacterium]|nr:putative SapB synthase [Pseudonocardiales bacterium]
MADPLFYDSPAAAPTGAAGTALGPVGHGEFEQTTGPVPADWDRRAMNEWMVMRPPISDLPSQGWKVHVSATVDNAQEILDIVARFCVERRVPFKFLSSRRVLMARNSKYADRGGSGKFVTIYPTGEAALDWILRDLGEELDGQSGPYILSDLRWRSGPLYVRYGGFRERLCRSEKGELVPGIEDPDGRLVPDLRTPSFSTPPWVTMPHILREALAARDAGAAEEFPYRIKEALHFSNGGGVYLAEDPRSGRTVLLKEARPMAGLDRVGADAVSRLEGERRILERLSRVDCVPQMLDYFTFWEHHFLVREYAEGVVLNRHMVRRHPLLRPDPTPERLADYTTWVLDIVEQVERGLDAIHARGVVFGDLHPANIIVSQDDKVQFIDFEVAAPADQAIRSTLGAPGYAAPPSYTGTAIDRHALGCIRLSLFTSLAPLIPWEPGKVDQFLEVVGQRFPVPADYRDKVWRDLGPRPFRDRPDTPAPDKCGPGLHKAIWPLTEVPDWKTVSSSMTEAILASATVDRTDRLFPGDISQFSPGGGVGFGYGAAGVLWALAQSGVDPLPEHEKWLLEAARRLEQPRPGFYHGLGGIAFALDRLGWRDEAAEILDQARRIPLDTLDNTLADGLPGIGLNLLHFARRTGERVLYDEAEQVAQRVIAGLRQAPASGARPGLMKGASGAALFLIRWAEETGDQEMFDHAETALRQDLAGCVWTEDRTFQANEGWRIVPYVATGSAGIGLVLHEFLQHRPSDDLAEVAAGIRRAAEPEFMVQAGFFNGRAGLMSYLLHTDDHSPAVSAALDRHVRSLGLHAVPYHGRVAFIGDQLMRMSMDLATGSAGILLVLGALLDGRNPGLPFIGSEGKFPSNDPEGGEHNVSDS